MACHARRLRPRCRIPVQHAIRVIPLLHLSVPSRAVRGLCDRFEPGPSGRCARHGWIGFDADYDELKEHFESGLPQDVELYNEYHALLVEVGKDLGEYFGTSEGLLVVKPPADSASPLKAGDVLLAIDGRKPQSVEHAFEILHSYAPGEKAKLEVMRKKHYDKSLRLLWIGIGDAKHISAVKDLRHLLSLRTTIKRHKGNGTAPNSGSSQRSNQQESYWRDNSCPNIGRLAQPDTYIFSKNHPDCS